MKRDFAGFRRYELPFPHWVNPRFLHPAELHEINAAWPDTAGDDRWHNEVRGWTQKSALMFPHRLPLPAHQIAEEMYGAAALDAMSEMIGIDVLPDPWWLDGPLVPRVGGGLHEIHQGGLLKMHIDFAAHPSGLTRALNFLLYLNEEWQDEWGGALQLGDDGVKIYPRGGTAVVFETTDTSWHGHPEPLTCPPDKSRRSLALYYYRRTVVPSERITTLYRQDEVKSR